MKVLFKKGDPFRIKTDCLILGVFEKAKFSREIISLDRNLNGVLSRAIKEKNFKGEFKETFFTFTLGKTEARSILLVGLGKEEEFTIERLRQAAGVSCKEARKNKASKICSLLLNTQRKGLARNLLAQAAVEGSILSQYRFTRHKTENEKSKTVEEITFLSIRDDKNDKVLAGAVDSAKKICEAVALARDLISQPGNYATPTFLADEAKKMALASGIKCKILNRKNMEDLGMGGVLGVAQGSEEEPKFIVLEYWRGSKKDAPVVLVGKGLTFDSGGVSIKPGQGMEEMKTDMSGGAAVIGALKAVSDLKLKLNVVGLIPATENMPDGKAIKPGDVLTTMSGKTIEVINTDAEGRLILSDALGYAERYKPSAVIDIATLTGACFTALGQHASGLMGTDKELMDSLVAAGETVGERLWPLPLFDEYDEQIKSDVADMKNIGGRGGGAITAAAMLKKFTSKYKWAHIDIAGTAWIDKDKPYIPKGAVGVGVRLFLQFLREFEVKKK
jgi:leucyl aminopeptidase